jgi:hypothetical protein
MASWSQAQEEEEGEGSLGGGMTANQKCPDFRQEHRAILDCLGTNSRCSVSSDWHLGHGGHATAAITKH